MRNTLSRNIIARVDVPNDHFKPGGLFVYVEAPVVYNGRVMPGGPLFRIDMGTNFDDPAGGITIGTLDRAIKLRDALIEVIDTYAIMKARED